MKVARAKLREIGPDDVNMEEYKVRDPSAAPDPSALTTGTVQVGSTCWHGCWHIRGVCSRELSGRQAHRTPSQLGGMPMQFTALINVSLTRGA